MSDETDETVITAITAITALFDIKRNKVDNHHLALKTMDDYLKWFKITLQLNCPMVIFTEENIVPFIEENRPKTYQTKIVVQKLEEVPYYCYRKRINEVLNDGYYINKISDPKRIECNLPEYVIIQYSKLDWVSSIAKENPFNSKYFFWMDAGISRFFYDTNINKPFPSQNIINNLNNTNGKIIAQCRYDINNIPINEDFIWTSKNVISGGLFGGSPEKIYFLAIEVKKIFESMLSKNNVNNEQLAIGIVWKYYKHLFNLVVNKREWKSHLPLFKIMTI